jgi:hypothetical protein
MVIVLLIRPGKLRRGVLALCLVTTALILAPWYINLPRSWNAWRITRDWLYYLPENFNPLTAPLRLVTQFFAGHDKHLWPGYRSASIVSLLLFGVGFVAMVWRLRARILNWRLALLWLPFAAACVGPMVFDFFRHTYTVAVPRYATAALPAAYLLAGVALSCLRGRVRLTLLVLILLSWAPNLWRFYRAPWRNASALCEIAGAASLNNQPSDLVLVHSIPSGVVGIAHYFNGPAAMASWVGQLGTRQMPESLRSLAAGRKRILFIKVHEVGEPAPEEEWLRANAVVFHEIRLGITSRLVSATLVDFRPKNSETF